MTYWRFPKYVTVGEKKKKAEKQLEKLRKKKPGIQPVTIRGRALTTTWWGKAWNRNLEHYADYTNRIERGRSYARHGAVLDLGIAPGRVTALVQGSAAKPYEISVTIKALSPAKWRRIRKACQGQIGSMKKLLAGSFPEALEDTLTRKGHGLFPSPAEIKFSCSCPDWASMCKHVAATLYGIGARLDEDPGLFFKLRKVRMEDLVSEAVAEASRSILQKAQRKSARVMENADLSDLFGIEMDDTPVDFDSAPSERLPKKPLKAKAAVGRGRKTTPASLKEIKAVEAAIRKSVTGATTGELVKATGLDVARVRYLIARLRQQQRITTPRRGCYTAVVGGPQVADRILEVVKRHTEGVTTAILVKETGLETIRVRNALARLKALKKIRARQRGLYVATIKRSMAPRTATAEVEKIVCGSRKGITVAGLARATGYDIPKIRNILYRLKTAGKIKAASRGTYRKA